MWGCGQCVRLRVGDTLLFPGLSQTSSCVPSARRFHTTSATPHETECRVGLLRFRAFSTGFGDMPFTATKRSAGKRIMENDSAVVLVGDCQLVTGVRAPGIAAEMDGECRCLESPPAPIKEGDQRVPWPVPAGHCSGKPDGAAAL